MSSSARPATDCCAASVSHAQLQPFPYPPVGYPLATQGSPSVGEPADEAGARDVQARAEGRQEGEAAARRAFEERVVQERAGIATALAAFTRDRGQYFQKVETEVVQLALSIARRILHRESQLDPELLMGMVRVALEKLDGATSVVLRIHPRDTADWRRYLARHLEPSDMPEIIEDSAQPADRCRLETSLGTADIGLEVQLKEIEQGLMDLLEARPEARP